MRDNSAGEHGNFRGDAAVMVVRDAAAPIFAIIRAAVMMRGVVVDDAAKKRRWMIVAGCMVSGVNDGNRHLQRKY